MRRAEIMADFVGSDQAVERRTTVAFAKPGPEVRVTQRTGIGDTNGRTGEVAARPKMRQALADLLGRARAIRDELAE